MLRKKSSETIRPCTMIITEPNRLVAEVHDRILALLRPEQFDAWLDGSAGQEVLLPEDMLQRRPVSKRAFRYQVVAERGSPDFCIELFVTGKSDPEPSSSAAVIGRANDLDLHLADDRGGLAIGDRHRCLS